VGWAESTVGRQGQFLLEAAAVQRAAEDFLAVPLVRFPAGGAEVLVAPSKGTGAEDFAVLPITADRYEIAAVVAPALQPIPGHFEGYPAEEPPLAVYAELLRDLGEQSYAFYAYHDGGFTYREISSDGHATARIVFDAPAGRRISAVLSLATGQPPIAIPYTLVDIAGKPDLPPGDYLLDAPADPPTTSAGRLALPPGSVD
jgi:hypothetical protein